MGTIVCCVHLMRVIAAAVDGETLHIAVQHEDVDDVIENGGLALCFPGAGTSLVVVSGSEPTSVALPCWPREVLYFLRWFYC